MSLPDIINNIIFSDNIVYFTIVNIQDLSTQKSKDTKHVAIYVYKENYGYKSHDLGISQNNIYYTLHYIGQSYLDDHGDELLGPYQLAELSQKVNTYLLLS